MQGYPGTIPPSSVPMTKVELSISAVNLYNMDLTSKSDPLCVMFVKEKGQDVFFEYGRTEMIKDTLAPQWVKKFEIDYRFEERQLIKFKVYDWDTKSTNTAEQDFLGEVECSLGEVMACQGSHLKKPISSTGGTVLISGEEMSSSKEVVTLTLSAKRLDKKDFFGKSDPFLVFNRCLSNDIFTVVHKTEVIKNTLDPTWKPVVVSVKTLCGSEEERPIKVHCYDWDSDGGHDLIGEFTTTLSRLRRGSGSTNTYTFMNPKKAHKSSYKGSGELILHRFDSHIEPSFLDYIRGGLQMHFTVAIDFTASNGDPRTPNSLHFRQPGVDNQYATAIKAVGEIIQDYDSDKMFPALGFGARLPPNWDVSHEFFLNGRTDSPYCQAVQGIIEAYYHSLQTVGLYGPTNFSPVIRHVMQFAKSHADGNNYFVLLIITDGIITDLNETKKCLVEASNLPMSVIIVGVGTEDFSAMELLDGDSKRLNYHGQYAVRDIVQFVELRRHLASGGGGAMSKELLARDVLAEVPEQLIYWMKSRNFSPKQPNQAQPIDTSFNNL